MRLLHTADWHIGKPLHGRPRDDEHRAVLEELVAVADREHVDAIVVAGDLLDRRLADPGHLGLCLSTLRRLGEVAPVLAVVGNHDDPELWTHLAPLLTRDRVTIGAAVPDTDAPVIDVETERAGPLHTVLVPWLEPAKLPLAAGADRGQARTMYASAAGTMIRRYAQLLEQRRRADGAPAVLVGHLMLDQSQAGGGERELSMAISYCLPTTGVPTGLDYIALGHIHRPQPLPGVSAPGAYAGSPLALDFSEDNHPKSVTVVDLGQAPRRVELAAGHRLITIRGPLDTLADRAREAAAGHDCWLRCRVELDAPMADLAREVQSLLPNALRVEPVYREQQEEGQEQAAAGLVADGNEDLVQQYEGWYRERGLSLDPLVAEAFRQALERAESDR